FIHTLIGRRSTRTPICCRSGGGKREEKPNKTRSRASRREEAERPATCASNQKSDGAIIAPSGTDGFWFKSGLENSRLTMTFTSTRLGQFTYFSEQLRETMWGRKNVLDFGGNIGNILRDPNSTIDPERYWCLDVDKDAIEQG